jgi:hypothetical protein
MIDAKSVIIGCFAGVLLGLITSALIASMLISSFGESFKVEDMNITISVNDSIIKDAMNKYDKYYNDTVDIPNKYELTKEYDRGFLKGLESYRSNILFAGSTFTYDKYVVKAWDIMPGKAEIVIMQDGYEIDRGFCYSNRFCNLNNISFQIDDIHIGKEANYLVYWSDK